jgi:hypothetical protein
MATAYCALLPLPQGDFRPAEPHRDPSGDQRACLENQDDDNMIPPRAQRRMAERAGATVAAGSHAIYVSKPEAVAALIAKAAKSVSAKMAAA